MMRKSEYYQKIDEYLDNELSGEELKDFKVEMLINPELAAEVNFYQEIQQAAQEKEIMKLRQNLSYIMKKELSSLSENFSMEEVLSGHQMMSYNFNLSNEIASLKEFFKPVDNDEINSLPHSLPRIHLFQHEIAAKENVHQFYKEQFEETESSDELFSPADEAIFAELQDALHEKDINDLRSNLSQIASGMPEYQWSDGEIDKYLNQDLKPEDMQLFEEELAFNGSLVRDVNLHKEVDSALMETDIINLRASLDQIQGTEQSDSGRVEKIEQYLQGELEEEELSVFEAELSANHALASEVAMYNEVDLALEEKDVMELRSGLQSISKDIIKERKRALRMPLSRVAITVVAASLTIILSIGGILTRKNISDTVLYKTYYQPYGTTGIVRSGNTMTDNTLTEALQKYNAGEYEPALQLFHHVLAYDANNPVAHFYSGVSYQETARFDKAIQEYDLVIRDRDNLFIEQAEWYIGLCYLQTQEKKKAYQYFERISKSNSYYNKKAEAIIRKLKYIE